MRGRVGFIGLGQAGGNITDLLFKKGYKSVVINTSREDLEVLSVEDKYLIPGAEGCCHDRGMSVEYAKDYYTEIIEKIGGVMSEVDIIFTVFSAGGGTGSGLGVLITDILSQVYRDKVIGAVCILPSLKEPVNIQVNAFKCFTELSRLEHIGGVFILDNDKDDKFNINIRFVDLIDKLMNITEYISKEGNIDKSEVKEVLSVRGCIVMAKAENPGKLIKSLDSSIFPNFKKGMTVVYMLSSLNNDIEVADLTVGLDIVPVDIFVNYNDTSDSLLVLSGLEFFQDRLDKIKDVIEKSKKHAEKAVSNSINSSLKDTLNWGIKMKKFEDKKVDFESIFDKY